MIKRVMLPCRHNAPLGLWHSRDALGQLLDSGCPGGRVAEIDIEKAALAILSLMPRLDDDCDIESDYCQRCLNDAREYVEVALAAALGET